MVLTAQTKKLKFYTDILPRNTKKALDFLSRQGWLKRSKWYLAGGTALALQVGHRQSVDLDFFIPQSDFKIASLLKHFSNANWVTNIAKESTVYGILYGAKISFIAYPFLAPKCDYAWYNNVRIIKPRDIEVMKIIAISQRGRKRDFFDLYWCAKNVESLEHAVLRLDDQYPTVKHNYHHIIKSLSYFDDAERDPAPKIFFKASWKEVKNFFRKEVVSLSRKILGIK